MNGDELIQDARTFALKAHAGQKRKYPKGTPYFEHLEAVANILRRQNARSAVIAAGYLHDTLEDTATTYLALLNRFGYEVAELVDKMTDRYTPQRCPKINRAQRKELEARRIAEHAGDADFCVLKVADLCDNTATIVLHDPSFAVVYLPECARVLSALGYGSMPREPR